MKRSPLPTVSAGASAVAEALQRMGTFNFAVLHAQRTGRERAREQSSLRALPAHDAIVARQKAITVREASASRQHESIMP